MLRSQLFALVVCFSSCSFITPNLIFGQTISPIVFSGQQLDSDRTVTEIPRDYGYSRSGFSFGADKILFLATIDDNSTGQSGVYAIFAGSISEFDEIARDGQTIPASDRTLSLSSYKSRGISQTGDATFGCRDNANQEVLLHHHDSSLSVLLHEDELTPDGTALVSILWRLTFTEEGNFATFARVVDTTTNFSRDSLFLLNDGVLQEVAREDREIGDTAIIPDSFVPFGPLGISNNNELAFPYRDNSDVDEYLVLNQNVDLVEQFTAPRISADDSDFCAINDMGTTFFTASRANSYQFRLGGNLIEVFRSTDPVPNGTGFFGRIRDTYNQESNLLNENNELAFSVSLRSAPFSAAFGDAVFRYSLATGLFEVIRTSDPLPDRLGNFSSMESYDFNDLGQVLLGGDVQNSGLDSDFAFYIHEADGSYTPIVKRDEPLLGSTIVDVFDLKLNEQGQVAFEFELADETRGIAIWDPNLLGDLNQNEAFDFLDVQPFVDLLLNSEYHVQGDFNRDGSVDFLDIGPFVETLMLN